MYSADLADKKPTSFLADLTSTEGGAASAKGHVVWVVLYHGIPGHAGGAPHLAGESSIPEATVLQDLLTFVDTSSGTLGGVLEASPDPSLIDGKSGGDLAAKSAIVRPESVHFGGF